MTHTTERVPHFERLREAVTMALYVGFSLLAVLLATPTSYLEHSRVRVATALALTALGLILAHYLAFRLSTRLLNRGVLDEESLGLLAAQFLGGLPIVAAVSVPVLLFGGPTGVRVSELLILAMVAAVGFITARSSGVSKRRALLHVGFVILLVGGVLVLKIAVKY